MPLRVAPLSCCKHRARSEALPRCPPESTKLPEWPPSRLVIERIRAHLSMCRAICGNSSLIWMPGTLVGMVP